MKSAKWLAGAFICSAGFGLPVCAAPQEKSVPARTAPAQAQPSQEASPPAPAAGMVERMLAQSSDAAGSLDAPQVKAMAEQMKFAEYRINDLLTDLHPERWKMSDAARGSFRQTIGALQTQMEALRGWRTRFAERPENMYAGYETYATIGTLVPRLEGVAATVSQADNPSFGAQFSRVADQLFDMQQKLGPYIGFLLEHHDAILQALENNLAGCQNDLGRAMQGQPRRPKNIRNSAPVRPRRTRTKPPKGNSDSVEE